MPDVSTRRLRCFLALAEELSFTRAAVRVGLAQQALSLQIRKLEEGLGVRLFERTTRQVSLTAAGAALLPEARRVVGAWERALAVLDECRREAVTLRLGFVAGAALELTGPILDEFAHRRPEVSLVQREFHRDDPSAGLGRGLVDVAFVRPPFGTAGLCLRELLVEPRVAGLRASHPLAGRESLSVRDLRDLPVVAVPHPDPVFGAFWTLARPAGEGGGDGHGGPRRVTMEAATPAEELMLVTTGQGFTVTALSAARYAPHPEVRYVPVRDIEGSALAVARRRDTDSELVEDFVASALAVRDREQAVVRAIRGEAE
ncbi:LysR substrate-binding domain-containing protein [Streptomyces albireticuli]|uniref:LysR substrate-binding domain-containing protein n=1 Tax=Streptomyces albireticuli TaxID=1940 RepID=UPI001E585991|nr:LysR substrate-binding domain-containing protein [Streptomyces albireticuli]MCD9145958.1 LysR substrate-binding domain-containing protein [Streptomyces albireticuli]MCD9194506.1 LysR substrate-binding domain-containing protein [Streptomyces albireticuli]